MVGLGQGQYGKVSGVCQWEVTGGRGLLEGGVGGGWTTRAAQGRINEVGWGQRGEGDEEAGTKKRCQKGKVDGQ